jgi:hypothetical protein
MEICPNQKGVSDAFDVKAMEKGLLFNEVIKTKKMTGLQWLIIVTKIAIKLVPPQSGKELAIS